jgi:hypothetical protein
LTQIVPLVPYETRCWDKRSGIETILLGAFVVGHVFRNKLTVVGKAHSAPVSVIVAAFEQYALGGNVGLELLVTRITGVHQLVASNTQGHLILGGDGASRADPRFIQLS